MIREVVVVVPVHDEADRLGECLTSIRHAAGHPALALTSVHVVVVLDSCADGSRAIARSALRSGDAIISVEARNVGVARAIGCGRGLELCRQTPPTAVWLATTDADTVVPDDWLARHLSPARSGWEAVAGVIRVADWQHHPDHVRARYLALLASRRRSDGGHTHVYGANLGVLASAYRSVGGFPPVDHGEDMALWRRLQRAGHRIIATQASWVTTSARSDPRAHAGLGDLLLSMDGQESAA